MEETLSKTKEQSKGKLKHDRKGSSPELNEGLLKEEKEEDPSKKFSPSKQIKNKMKPKTKYNPLEEANIFQKLSFSWLKEVFQVSKNTYWRDKFNYDLARKDQIDNMKQKLFDELFKVRNGCYLSSVLKVFSGGIMKLIVMALMSTMLRSGSIFLILYSIELWITDRDSEPPIQTLSCLTAASALMMFLSTVIYHYYNFDSARMGIKAKSLSMAILVDKAIMLKEFDGSELRKSNLEGRFLNLFGVDLARVEDFFSAVYRLTTKGSSLFVVTLVLFNLIELELAILVVLTYAVASLMVFFLLLILICSISQLLRKKDLRMGYLHNCLDLLMYLKQMAYENVMHLKIFRRRELEVKILKRIAFVLALVSGVKVLSRVIALMSVIFHFLIYGERFDFKNFWVFIVLVQLASINFEKCIEEVIHVVEIRISFKRIDQFMEEKEAIFDYIHTMNVPVYKTAVLIEGDGFSFPKRAKNKKKKSQRSQKSKSDYNYNKKAISGSSSIRKSSKSRISLASKAGQTLKTEDDFLALDDSGEPMILPSDNSLDELKTEQTETDSERTDPKRAEKADIKPIELSIMRGERVLIMGPPGSGKSGLLKTMLGEMEAANRSSKVHLNGSVAYMPQENWIMNGSIKENILMGRKYKKKAMNEALYCAQFNHEVLNFNNGMSTVVKDAGCLLTEAQKSRICLTRTFYQHADIYLLDDPTSSLDSVVIKRIFNHLKKDELWKDRTYVIASNESKLLQHVDRVIYMQEGRMEFEGSVEDFLKTNIYVRLSLSLDETNKNELLSISQHRSEVAFYEQLSDEIAQLTDKVFEESESEYSSVIKELESKDTANKENYFLPEPRLKGRTQPNFYRRLIRTSGGYFWLLITILTPTTSSLCNYSLFDSMMTFKSDHFPEPKHKDKRADYESLLECFSLGFVMLVCGLTQSIVVYRSFAKLSEKMHSKMVFSVLHSKLFNHFERFRLGIFINLFSYDVNYVDRELPYWIDSAFTNFFSFFSILSFLVTYVQLSPILALLVPFLIYVVMTTRVRSKYMRSKVEFLRLYSRSRSAVVTTAVNAFKGRMVIRTSKKNRFFSQKIASRINENAKTGVFSAALDSWFGFRQSIYTLFLLYGATPAVLFSLIYFLDISEKTQKMSMAYFSLTIFTIAGLFDEFLQILSNFEARMIHFERCSDVENMPSEKGYATLENDYYRFGIPLGRDHEGSVKLYEMENRVPKFDHGELEFKEACAGYPSTGQIFIYGLNLKATPGTKVGIIGRTACGKSSLVKLIWRGLEVQQGEILVDGESSQKLDLKGYRSQITIIPQKPWIIAGTIKSNITPYPLSFIQKSDLLNILIDFGFPSNKLQKKGINYRVKAHGVNLSKGERQIIALTRAFFHKSKIVVFEEASASLSMGIINSFQRRAKKWFSNCSFILVSHCVRSVLNCDRVYVLENGKLVRHGVETSEEAGEHITNKSSLTDSVYGKT